MGQCASKMIFGFLDNIQKVLTYDPVAFSFIAFNIIYKLFEWMDVSKNIKGKIALQFRKENKCLACKKKELSPRLPTILHKNSYHSNQVLYFQNIQIDMASFSATMSFKNCITRRPRGSALPETKPKMITEHSSTGKPTALDVKTDVITSNKNYRNMSPSLLLGVDDGKLKLYGSKINDEQQFSILQQTKQILNDVTFLPVPTNSNSWEAPESGEIKHMPGTDQQAQSMSPIKSPFRYVSKLKMHFLRKLFENQMVFFPQIVQRSVHMYHESCQISSNWKRFSLSTEPYMDRNEPKRAPKLKSGIPVQNVTPLPKTTIAAEEYCTNTVPRKVTLPIAHRSYHKKLALSVNFKRSKRQTRKGTDLPIGIILHFGKKIMQTLSPDSCIDKSHKGIKNNRTTKSKIQNHFLESGNIEGSMVARPKLQTANINNKMKAIEKHKSNGIIIPKSQESPITNVTKHIYCNPLQEPKILPNALVDDQHVSTGLVRVGEVIYSCSDRKTSTRLFHSTVSDKPSIFRLPEVCKCFKRLLVSTLEPCPLQRRLLRGKTT